MRSWIRLRSSSIRPKQIELYKQAQAIAVDEVAIAPLFDQQTIIAYRPWVRGLTQRIAYAPSLETVYLVRTRPSSP